jgi:hypothetical protein
VGQDLRVGDVITLEGGAGGTFMRGTLVAGIVYGGQWKVSDDRGSGFPSNVAVPGKSQLYTAGPEVRYTPYNKDSWRASFTARYLWDFAARSSFQGQRVMVFATIGRLLEPPAGAGAVAAVR